MSYVITPSRSWHESVARRLHARCGQAFHLVTWRRELTVGVSAAEAFKLGRKLLLLNRGGT